MPHPFLERLVRRPPVLYALLDRGLVEAGDMVEEGIRLAEAGVDLLQLRAKDAGGAELEGWARQLLPPLRARGVPLLLNDRVDVALAVEADGVHLGRGDLPVGDARRLLGPHALIGATAHSLAELAEVDPGADYVGYGAVYATQTRAHSEVCGPGALTAVTAASTLPVVAIGGLSPDNLEPLRSTGIAGVAVASAVSPTRARPGAVEALRRVLARW